ncbi:unnamed protein product [Caenorhabditis auriculariae]|uniref:Uncharacterized protein n=1 Tax=Caenorhabditis auriculariae TaxID=2777116 RepID=A0A8S1HRG8_9PELO|nr:unnamed protein product [Caenorhabditis auriculariae]
MVYVESAYLDEKPREAAPAPPPAEEQQAPEVILQNIVAELPNLTPHQLDEAIDLYRQHHTPQKQQQYRNEQHQYRQEPQQYRQEQQHYRQKPQQHRQESQQYRQEPQQYRQKPQQHRQESQQYRQEPQQYRQEPQQYRQEPQQHRQEPQHYRQEPQQYQQRAPHEVQSEYYDFDENIPAMYREQKRAAAYAARNSPSVAPPAVQNDLVTSFDRRNEQQRGATPAPSIPNQQHRLQSGSTEQHQEASGIGNLEQSLHTNCRNYFAPPKALKNFYANMARVAEVAGVDNMASAESTYIFDTSEAEKNLVSGQQYTQDYKTLQYIPGFSPPDENRELQRADVVSPNGDQRSPVVATENVYRIVGAVPQLQQQFNAAEHAEYFQQRRENPAQVETQSEGRGEEATESSTEQASDEKTTTEAMSEYVGFTNEETFATAQPVRKEAHPTGDSSRESRYTISSQETSCETAQLGPSKFSNLPSRAIGQHASPNARSAQAGRNVGGYAFQPVDQLGPSEYQMADLNELSSLLEARNG